MMPSALAATTNGSPELSRVIISASARLTPSARSSTRMNSPWSRLSAAFSRRRTSSPATGAGRRGADLGCDIEIGEDEPALVGACGKEQRDEVVARGFAAAASSRRGRSGKLAQDRVWRGRIGRQAGCHGRARLRVDSVNEPQRQLDELGFLFGAMDGLLDVEVGDHAEQGRADIHAIPARQIDQTVQ